MKPAQVKKYLIAQYPEFGKAISQVEVLSVSCGNKTNVADAVTQIVIGQMLSRHAAQTIYKRVEATRIEKKLEGGWKLSATELAAQGVSARKARSIIEFGKKYEKNPKHYENWRKLTYSDLQVEVSSQWGLSTWSADILAISHFGFKDVFPDNDGTLKRAVAILNDSYYLKSKFQAEKAKPYRTFLSLYLWRLIDDKIITGVA